MVVTILRAHFVTVVDVSLCLDFLRKEGVWNPSKVWGERSSYQELSARLSLIPQHVLDTLTSFLYRYKKPMLPALRLLS